MGYVEYSSNNSGGGWWLKDEDWKALEKAGWVIEWAWLTPVYEDNDCKRDDKGLPLLERKDPATAKYSWEKLQEGERYMGALSTRAFKPNCDSLAQAVEEWERITGESSTDAGCPCCGVPHKFTLYDDEGEFLKSGPESTYAASW